MPSPISFTEALAHLAEHDIEFIVVGGVAALAHGAALPTEDLDVVYRVSERNISLLLEALSEIDAVYLDPAGRRIKPDLGKLGDIKINLLETNLGRIDLLQEIGRAWDYETLLEKCRIVDFEGLSVRILDLETLIEAKMVANRPKDQMALPILRQTLAVIRSRKKETETR